MRTNLAERRIGYEPPEVPERESLEERRARIRAIYQYRKALRRVAKVCSLWVGGVAFALAVIAGYAELTDAAVITGAISLGCTAFGAL